MPKGGKQPGAGRPPGASTKLTRRVANELARSGAPTPLIVMIENMTFWYQHAEKMKSQIEQVMTALTSNQSEELVDKAKEMLKGFLAARDNAQSCAVDAAPYVHPKLQSIAMKANLSQVIEVETVIPSSSSKDGEEEGEDDSRSYRKNYDATNVTPIRRTS